MSERVQVGRLGQAWIVGVVAYSIARALLAWPTLGQYGVNPWVFLTIDLVTALPYGTGQVKIVNGFRQQKYGAVQLWALVVLVTFVAPYVYIFAAGRESMPLWVYGVIAAIMLVFAVASILRIRRDVREARSWTSADGHGSTMGRS